MSEYNDKKGVFNRAVRDQYVEFLEHGVPSRLAAERCHVSYRTVQRHLEFDPSFARRVAEAPAIALERIVGSLYDNALDGNLPAQRFYLTNRAPDDWLDPRDVPHRSTTPGHRAPAKEMTPEEAKIYKQRAIRYCEYAIAHGEYLMDPHAEEPPKPDFMIEDPDWYKL